MVSRALFAFAMFVLGSMQAWDSDAYQAGLWVVLLVNVAITLPAESLLLPVKPVVFIGAIFASLVLLVIARLIAPIQLPGLFLILAPSAMGLIYIGVTEKQQQDMRSGKGGEDE
jgi:hypothetical protein